MIDASRKDEFVSLFPANRKSGICNKILEQIRAGEASPSVVMRKLAEKLNRFPEDNGDLLFILAMNQALFMDAIDYYIEYEKLSHAEKQKLKQSNSREYIEQYMDKQSITESQIWKLRKLGYSGTYDLTKLQASRKIEELLP